MKLSHLYIGLFLSLFVSSCSSSISGGAQNSTDKKFENATNSDVDGDGILNEEDNCPTLPNEDQLDSNGNGIGDICEDLSCATNFCQDAEILDGYACDLDFSIRCGIDEEGCLVERSRLPCSVGCQESGAQAGICEPPPPNPNAPDVTSVLRDGSETGFVEGSRLVVSGSDFGGNSQVDFVEFTGGSSGWINKTPVGTRVQDLFPGGDASKSFRSNESRFSSSNASGGIWTYQGMHAGKINEDIDNTHFRSGGRSFHSKNFTQGAVPGEDQSCNFQWRSRDEGMTQDRPWRNLFFSGWYYNKPRMAPGTSSSNIGGKAIRFLPVDIPWDPVSDLPYSFYIGWGWDGQYSPPRTKQNQMAWYTLLYTNPIYWPDGAPSDRPDCAAFWHAKSATILSNLAPYPTTNPDETNNCATFWNFKVTDRNGSVSTPLESQSAAVDKWQRYDFYIEEGTLGTPSGKYAMRVLTPSEGWHTYPMEIENITMSVPGVADSVLYPKPYGGLSTILWQFHNQGVAGEPTSGGQIWEVWVDDIFIQRESQARIEIGNADNYYNCTNLEIQRPLSWSENQVEIELGFGGSFSPGEALYLFVVRGDGRISSGYPIAVE